MPLSRLYPASVLLHRSIGGGYYRLVLKAPEIAAAALPGQFVMLRVADGNEPLLARPFGISSIVGRGGIEVVYRVVGRGTALLSGVEPGRTLTLLGPLGKGFPAPPQNAVPLLVAGGSGFPPLYFFVRRTRVRSHFFIGARDKGCLPPASVLKNFREAAKTHVATQDGSAGRQGMVTEMLSDFLSRQEDKKSLVIYACGPHAMLSSVSRLAKEHEVVCYVSMEERMACGLGACMGCSIPMKAGGYKRACKEGPVFDARDIDWSERVLLPLAHLAKKPRA